MRRRSLGRSVLQAVPSALALLLVLAGGCGAPEKEAGRPTTTAPAAKALPPPATDEAKALVSNSPEFSDYEFTNAALTIPLAHGPMSGEQRSAVKDLASAGWLTTGSDGVALTGKAKSDRRWLVRPNATADIVPLASKEVLEVSAVASGADGSPQVGFRWRWIPNEIGAAILHGAVHERFSKPHGATATLLRDGSRWTVLRILPAAD